MTRQPTVPDKEFLWIKDTEICYHMEARIQWFNLLV